MADELPQPFDPSTQGQTIFIAVRVGYPGSKVTDLLVGDYRVQIPNEDLIMAGRKYLQLHGATEGLGEAYDVQINTVAMFGGEEEFGE